MESSICDRAMSFLRYKSLNSSFKAFFAPCGRAVRAKRNFFHVSIPIVDTINLFFGPSLKIAVLRHAKRDFFRGKLRMCKLCLEPKYLVNSLKNEVTVHKKVQTENLKIHSKPTSLKIVLWFLYLVSFLRSLRSLRNDKKNCISRYHQKF